MTVETVKATYSDRLGTKSVYVNLTKGKIVKTETSFDTEIHYDLDKNGEIVGVKVLLS